MRDSISRQAVLDMLEDINNHVIDGCGYNHKWCVKWVKGLPSIDAIPQWIPCEESLPMVTEVVLIYVYYEFIDIGWMRSDGNWDTQFGVYDKRNITHWMPLPKPPKEEEE